MNFSKLTAVAAISLLCAACSTSPRNSDSTQNGTSTAKATRTVKSRDGSFSGEIVGTPSAGSKFAKLKIGMDLNETQQILGRSPDRSHSYESGKRWIPFYFGNDARRVQTLYKGEGCLIFTGGNVWGVAGGDLLQIEHDPTGACYQP